ncbi:hypothetical protein TNCV_1546361 [Trichonephila clavipes]|nr:hypothetical protein TNCV_1546361 [Trichonephila clavipes]
MMAMNQLKLEELKDTGGEIGKGERKIVWGRGCSEKIAVNLLACCNCLTSTGKVPLSNSEANTPALLPNGMSGWDGPDIIKWNRLFRSGALQLRGEGIERGVQGDGMESKDRIGLDFGKMTPPDRKREVDRI